MAMDKGDGYNGGYICASCKGRGTVYSRRTVGSLKCDIYDKDPALASITSSTFTGVRLVTPYRAKVEMDVALFLTKDQSLGL